MGYTRTCAILTGKINRKPLNLGLIFDPFQPSKFRDTPSLTSRRDAYFGADQDGVQENRVRAVVPSEK